jgi:hypothetical protein
LLDGIEVPGPRAFLLGRGIIVHPKGFENCVAVEDPAVRTAVDRQGHLAGTLSTPERHAAVAGEGQEFGQVDARGHGASCKIASIMTGHMAALNGPDPKASGFRPARMLAFRCSCHCS